MLIFSLFPIFFSYWANWLLVLLGLLGFSEAASENIDEIDSSFGGADVVGVALIDFGAAVDTLVLLVIDVVVAETDGGFDVPMAVENPAVSVGNAASGKPTFVAIVLHVVPQGEDGRLNAHGVVDPAHEVETKEMTVEDVAKPIA